MKQLMKPLNHIISFFSVKKNNLSILLPHVGNMIRSNRIAKGRLEFFTRIMNFASKNQLSLEMGQR